MLNELGMEYIVAERAEQLAGIVAQGKVAVFADGAQLSESGGMDAVYEATGTILAGGEYAVQVLRSRKHLVLMNSEIDLIFGPYLNRLAKENGVVCTSCGGDQYGALTPLIGDLKRWGFQLVMAGNMKGFLDRRANPTSIVPEADLRRLDYRACASYTDGTKLNIEMAIVANAFGLQTKVSGMYGPKCSDIDNVHMVFDFAALWQDREPFVDYTLGSSPGGGVFAIGYCDDPYQRQMLQYYKMGGGPFYTFYRPYHLCHIESLDAAFDAVQKQSTFLWPEYGFVTNVYAYAKQDLQMGDDLDGIGGYTCYGLIENCAEQAASPGIPICLADRVRLKRAIGKDEKILLSDVVFDADRPDFRMFVLAGGTL
ncbi:MAG: homoserine dehydrogenase [Firmicutes bacterium]|nr:homoserine dehydrogenase [Bacillota bacterium]